MHLSLADAKRHLILSDEKRYCAGDLLRPKFFSFPLSSLTPRTHTHTPLSIALSLSPLLARSLTLWPESQLVLAGVLHTGRALGRGCVRVLLHGPCEGCTRVHGRCQRLGYRGMKCPFGTGTGPGRCTCPCLLRHILRWPAGSKSVRNVRHDEGSVCDSALSLSLFFASKARTCIDV
jgi:hypothetical protein